jgi:WD40 repeat protein
MVVVDGPAAHFGRSLAVVIGIDTYRGGIAPLGSAVADAKAIAEALRRDHDFETRCLLNGEATLARLLELLRDELPAMLGESDRLVFYFAGHGIALDGDAGPTGYLLPTDARRADRDSFLPMHVLHGELTRLPVRHAFVILDCCFAGAFRWSSLRDVAPDITKVYRERYNRYVERAAWQVLTSASSNQPALDRLANDRDEGGGTHSPFARALLEGLTGAADYTQDNLCTADEIAMFVRERVAPAAESAGCRQTPQLFELDRHDDGQFVFQVPRQSIALMPAPPLDERANPYRGLRSYREHDRALFFGRDAVGQRLLEAVLAQRLTVVVGPSSCGKSSLVEAGLIPALRAQDVTVLPSQRPGREPLAALEALTRALGAEPTPQEPVAAWQAAVAAHARTHPGQPWVVIIDQLEELQHAPAHDQDAFLGALASALEAAAGPHVVVAVRADVEPELHRSALAPWWTAARFAVPAMTRDELREIIQKPAHAAVLNFEPSRLVERLLDDVALVPAPLPLLSFTLSELYRRCWLRWQAGVRDRALREADYDDMGSVARALTQRATALYQTLLAEQPAYAITIRNVVNRMVAIVGGERARRLVLLDELDYDDPAENRRVHEVLQRFHEARLISLGTEPSQGGGTGRYAEPMHDDLIRGTQVSRWLDELDTPAGTRALLGALGSAVTAWQAGKQARSLLWTDPRVELADQLVRNRPFALNAREARFVRRSIRLRRHRRWRLFGGLIALIAVLAVTTGTMLWERQNALAERDEIRQLLASLYQESGRQLLFDDHPLEAVPYLLEARKLAAAKGPLRTLFSAAARRLPVLWLEHQGSVTSATWSPDGTRVITASWDHTARIWDARTGQPLTPPLRHQDLVSSAAWSPDGTRVVTASLDNTARIWDARTGWPLTPPLTHQAYVSSAAWSPDGTRVVTASDDRTVRIWDARTGQPLLPPLVHQDYVSSVAWSPDGTRLVTAGFDMTARIWDAASGQLLAPPLLHEGIVRSAAWSPDGTRVVTAGDDKVARVWDAASGQLLTSPLSHGGLVWTAAWSPDGTRIATASWDNTARVWDATTGQPLTPPLTHQGHVSSVAWSPDGKHLVTAGSDDNTARVWDAASGQPLSPPLTHQGSVRSAAWSPDGTRVVTASWDRAARVWDVTIDQAPPLAHHGSVHSAAFSPDGTRVVTASGDKTARVWDAGSGHPLSPPLEHDRSVISAAWSPDGKRLVTASLGNTARVWDASSGKPVSPPLMHQGSVSSAAWSRDGTRIVTASWDNTARVWDAMTGAPLSPPLTHQGNVLGAAFSPDGTRVVTASDDQTARIWDAATGRPLSPPLAHHGSVLSAAWSPDGTRVITASWDNTARIWDATTGQPVAPPLRHQATVLAAAWSPDGTRVVTASADKTARVWDAATGRPLSPPLEHESAVWSAAWSPDGTRLVTASKDQTARVWDAGSGKPLTPPLVHQGSVLGAAWSPDGTRVVTASDDQTARVWAIPLDRGTLGDWSAIAARSPYVLVNGVLSPRAAPAAENSPD